MFSNNDTGVQFRAEASRVLRLAMPLAMGQFAIMGMGVTDVIVAGRAGTDDLAAVTVGFYVWDLAMLLVFGIVLANSALIGHHFGAGAPERVRHQFQQCMWLAVPLSLFSGAAIFAAMRGVHLLDLTPEVAGIAAAYLLPTIGTAMLVPFAVCLRTTAEGLGLPRPVMWLSIGVFLLNIPLDYALVHGVFGLPGLGGAGCGWASLIAFALLLGCWVLYTLRSPTMRRYRLWHAFSPPVRRDLGAILALGLPIGLSLLGVGGFFSVVPLMMAQLGTVALAGHSVAMSVDMIMLTLPLGVGQAMSVRVAHELGAGRPMAARQVCLAGLQLLIGIALLQASLIVMLRKQIATLFSSDPQVIALGASLLLFAAACRVFDSIQIGGGMALRGYKDTRFASGVNLASYWLFGLPLCYALGLTPLIVRPMGVYGFWTGMLVCIALVSTLILLRLLRTSHRALASPAVRHVSSSPGKLLRA